MQRQRMLDRAAEWAKGEWTEEDSPVAAPVNLGGQDDEQDMPEVAQAAATQSSAPPTEVAASALSSSETSDAAGPIAAASDESYLPGTAQEGAATGKGRKRRSRLIPRRT